MMVRFDMSEYVGTGSVLRLIGSPPGYHGHEDGGQLTEKVRTRPYSVILFDEVEKADPSVFNLWKRFKPELLNRLSEIVIFEPLSHDKLKKIVHIQMKSVVSSVAAKGISLLATDGALDVILSQSYNPMYGARPVWRWVQKNVVTKLSEMLITGEAGKGSTVSIEATDDNKGLNYQVSKEAAVGMRPTDRGKRQVVELPSD
ncbi:hypothetical protein GUJ93_ZPchr0006g45651 [Zizania palustris]|uniref:Clp ATPase C-terminal domain-containing protein n=1 Tax=Zizania palustris TaxID=103762 RepID=A0A8J5W2N0_ZIZPA|nr:hypothetical protein GUJ93_ZPchr0006g45651 [Zizania palustris]